MQMDIFIGLVVVWLLFGIACAMIATNKGRSGGGWFTLGFLLGPFALILALVVSKNQEVIDNESLQSGEMKRCPYCAELIKTAAIKCRFCGEDLPENQLQDSSDTCATDSQKQSELGEKQSWDSSDISDEKPSIIFAAIVAGIVVLILLIIMTQ